MTVRVDLNRTQGSPARALVLDAQVEFHTHELVTPFQLSTGTIYQSTEAQVAVTIETAEPHKVSVGRGSIVLGELWAWPKNTLGNERCESVLRNLCEKTASHLPEILGKEPLHPIELGLRLHDWVCHEADIPHNPPLLARAMCASPFDAAIHDAVGIALGCSAFQLYDNEQSIPSSDHLFPEGGTIHAISGLLRRPKTELPAWLIVNKSDNLQTTLAESVKRGGYRCFKLKITGNDCEADVLRTAEVYQALKSLGIESPILSVDSNEANPDATSVERYLTLLLAEDMEAFNALQYLEQPTGRDIGCYNYDWTKITAMKPVFLDEGLTDLSVLPQAKAQGWSGLALKTCKGHSMLLASAAWGHQNDMLLSLQDLTNPGIALIHAALVGAHLPTINGVELNSPQFIPVANEAFLPRLSSLFEPKEGVHQLPNAIPIGLGSNL